MERAMTIQGGCPPLQFTVSFSKRYRLSPSLRASDRVRNQPESDLICRLALHDSIGGFVGPKDSDALVLVSRIVGCEKPGPLFRTMNFLCRIVEGEKPGPLFRTMLTT